jgi:hypothetical protein
MSQPEPALAETAACTGARARRLRASVVLLLVIAALALVALDRRLVESPDGGFLPDSATWHAEVADIPALFRHWSDLNNSAAMRRASPALHQDVPLALCRMTGIRPTPFRTRLWLGRTLVVGGSAEGWCLSVRPGLALRLASWLGGPLRAADEDDFWRNYASAWHEGFLLVASSPAYLEKVLAEARAVPKPSAPEDTIRVAWEGAYPGMLEVAAADQIPLLFKLKVPADPQATLHYAAGWPEVLLTFNTHRGAPIADATVAGLAWAEGQLDADTARVMRALFATWWPTYCPLDLGKAPVGEWALGVAAADFSPDVPVVESIWAGRVSDPAALTTLVPDTRQEHRWDEVPGWLIPLSGDARTWALAEKEGTTFLASHEARMPALLSTARREPEAGVAALNVRWKPLVTTLRGALTRAAKDGLLPGWNEDDLQTGVLPYLDAFADWGSIQLKAGSEGGEVVGSGWFALGAELVP